MKCSRQKKSDHLFTFPSWETKLRFEHGSSVGSLDQCLSGRAIQRAALLIGIAPSKLIGILTLSSVASLSMGIESVLTDLAIEEGTVLLAPAS